jgi:hypothetical protein
MRRTMDQAARQLCRQTANVSARNVLKMARGILIHRDND